MLGFLRRPAEAQARRQLGPAGADIVEDRANSFGVQSRGVLQIRGNGCLAANGQTVVFVMWWPRRILRIPRDRITAISTPRAHLGKTTGARLLHIAFTGEDGRSDSVAFAVRDLDPWLTYLDA